MHNGQMANPIDDREGASTLKELTSTRKKTDSIHHQISDLEFRLGLYWADKVGVFLPGDNVKAMIWEAAKKTGKGRQMVGVEVLEDECPLVFKNHKNLKALQSDPEMRSKVMVSSNGRPGGPKVLRTRPKIPVGWSLTTTLRVDDESLRVSELPAILEMGGSVIGLGDWRPSAKKPGKFGTFIVEECEEIKHG